jgi:hypothetical protein
MFGRRRSPRSPDRRRSDPTQDRAADSGRSPAPPDDPLAVLLVRRLESIDAELTVASGGQSLCAISRSVGSVPAVKYLEGRRAAINEVRRGVRAGRPFVEVLAERTSAWRAELARTIESSMGADWRAYRAGGVDELESLEAPSRPSR